ncbi:hypothetical protein LJR098_001064 [Rhizobium sp. LjRoot98]|uniref:hypothetical protein n=1 Tax=Rhizobium sp. LjRoot98 TaxID=3342345 RepID=UPI003ECDF52E
MRCSGWLLNEVRNLDLHNASNHVSNLTGVGGNSMIWPFGKKKEAGVKLVYKPEGFLEYQCKYGHTDIQPRKVGIVALVLDAQKEFGTSKPVTVKPDGTQQAVLRVASDDGGFIVNSQTAKPGGQPLVPGDIVVWLPWEYVEHPLMQQRDIDKRFGWVGFIMAKVKPEVDPSNPNLAIICKYD